MGVYVKQYETRLSTEHFERIFALQRIKQFGGSRPNDAPESKASINAFKDQKHCDENEKLISRVEKDMQDLVNVHKILSEIKMVDKFQIKIEDFKILDTIARTKFEEGSPSQILFEEFLDQVETLNKQEEVVETVEQSKVKPKA